MARKLSTPILAAFLLSLLTAIAPLVVWVVYALSARARLNELGERVGVAAGERALGGALAICCFSRGRRGAVIRPRGKTRITIYLDDDVLERFRERADRAGLGWVTRR